MTFSVISQGIIHSFIRAWLADMKSFIVQNKRCRTKMFTYVLHFYVKQIRFNFLIQVLYIYLVTFVFSFNL